MTKLSAQLTPIILEEINYGFEKELQSGKRTSKGIEVTAMDFFGSIVHRSAARVMIGTELCRNETFLNETTGLFRSIFFTAIFAVNVPLGPFRNALAGLFTLPHKWKLARCSNALQPVVEARLKAREASTNGQTQESLGDAVEWTLDLVKSGSENTTLERLTHELLHNLWAASSAPGGMMTEIVYQMLTYPEYIEPMKAEAEVAVAAHGWTEKMLANLHLQDSFIREVNRVLPTGASKYSRTFHLWSL